jgi:hypothetical protein
MHEFAEWIPLLQTLLWAGLIAGVLVRGRHHWNGILSALRKRVEHGDTVKLGVGSFSAELEREAQGVPRITPGDEGALNTVARPTDELEEFRGDVGRSQRGVHLVHIATPSEDPDQECDLFVFLTGWRRSAYGLPDDLSDVSTADFHLGPNFHPSGTTITYRHGSVLGFVTSAWGPVICVCRVTFTDGEQVVLTRYLDFESAELTERVLKNG